MVGLGNGDFCACGKEDCLTAAVPCQCTKETGGQFAYNPPGLLKDCFCKAVVMYLGFLLASVMLNVDAIVDVVIVWFSRG